MTPPLPTEMIDGICQHLRSDWGDVSARNGATLLALARAHSSFRISALSALFHSLAFTFDEVYPNLRDPCLMALITQAGVQKYVRTVYFHDDWCENMNSARLRRLPPADSWTWTKEDSNNICSLIKAIDSKSTLSLSLIRQWSDTSYAKDFGRWGFPLIDIGSKQLFLRLGLLFFLCPRLSQLGLGLKEDIGEVDKSILIDHLELAKKKDKKILNELESLHLDRINRPGLGEIDMVSWAVFFSNLPSLRQFHVSGFSICKTSHAPRHGYAASHITSLRLHSCMIQLEPLRRALLAFDSLKNISIWNCSFSEVHISGYYFDYGPLLSRCLPRAQYLEIGNSNGHSRLGDIGGLRDLKTLLVDLSGLLGRSWTVVRFPNGDQAFGTTTARGSVPRNIYVETNETCIPPPLQYWWTTFPASLESLVIFADFPDEAHNFEFWVQVTFEVIQIMRSLSIPQLSSIVLYRLPIDNTMDRLGLGDWHCVHIDYAHTNNRHWQDRYDTTWERYGQSPSQRRDMPDRFSSGPKYPACVDREGRPLRFWR